jgi:hypothetical protein
LHPPSNCVFCRSRWAPVSLQRFHPTSPCPSSIPPSRTWPQRACSLRHSSPSRSFTLLVLRVPSRKWFHSWCIRSKQRGPSSSPPSLCSPLPRFRMLLTCPLSANTNLARTQPWCSAVVLA